MTIPVLESAYSFKLIDTQVLVLENDGFELVDCTDDVLVEDKSFACLDLLLEFFHNLNGFGSPLGCWLMAVLFLLFYHFAKRT